MASRYLQPVSISWRTLRRIALSVSIALYSAASLPLHASAASPELQPYTAHYRTTTRGIGMSVTRTLEAGEDDSFVLTNGGKILVMGFHEVGVFRVDDGQIMPLSYVYQGAGLINRRRELHFDRERARIDSLYKDHWYQLSYSDSTLDRMSQLEQLRLTLLADGEQHHDIIMRVADGKRVKDSHLVLIGEESLETPLGTVDTLHYNRLHDSSDRSSDIWVAPKWDYLMVKTVHVEDGKPVEMVLTSAAIAGVPVTAD